MDLITKFKEKNGFKYLSDSDTNRLSAYETFQQILDGEHQNAFDAGSKNVNPDRRKEIDEYIVANFGALISRVNADFLFGENAAFDLDTEDEEARKKLSEIEKRSELAKNNWEAAYTASAWGDVVIKVRTIEDKAIIEYVNPQYYIPVFETDNVNMLKGVILAWEKTIDDNKFLKVEIHEPQKITNQMWLLEGDVCVNQVDLSMFYENLPQTVPTDTDKLLVKLIPNYSYTGRHFGISDYSDLISLFKAINNRLSRAETALNRYSDPILALPSGVLDEEGKIKRGDNKVFEVLGGKAGGLLSPEYITWNGKLENAFKEVELLSDLILTLSETSKATLGDDKNGQAESGRALKFKMIRTLSKIARKQRYFEEGLKYSLETALTLEGVSEENINVNITWNDGIPTDEREQAELDEINIRSGRESLESVIRSRMAGASKDEIDAELKRLKNSETII